MRRYAILVDAGYLLMAGASATLGATERSEVTVNYEPLVRWLIARAVAATASGELLRLYWYDASQQKLPTSEHLVLAEQPDTKLRLGYLTQSGQKGVDALIFSDMIELARCGAVADMVLVAGDGDHLEAVERSQALGVRVHLWGVATPSGSVSPELRRAADRVELLDTADLSPFFGRALAPPVVRPGWMDQRAPGPASPARHASHDGLRIYTAVDPGEARSSGARFAASWRSLASPAQLGEVTAAERSSIPQAVDGRLLRYACEDLGLPPGAELSVEARLAIRAGFWDAIDNAPG